MGVKVREKIKNSGVWWVFIDHQGRRKAKKIGRDKRVALEVAKKIEAKLTLGELGFEKKTAEQLPLFKEFAQYWSSYTLRATCKFSTQLDYKSVLDNHVMPVFSDVPVAEITRKSIRSFLIEKSRAGYAPSTVSHMKSCIAGVLEVAIDDEVISQNPAHRIGKYHNSSNGLSEINDGIHFLKKEGSSD